MRYANCRYCGSTVTAFLRLPWSTLGDYGASQPRDTKLKRIAFAALAALAATSASAADMAARNYTKAPTMAAVASWTGFYAGLNIGYGFNDPVATFTANDVVSNSIIGNVGTAALPV